MQTFRSAPVPLLIALCLLPSTLCKAHAATPARPPKTHAVTLGPVRRVPYTPPETERNHRNEESTVLKVRALFVDTRQKEWTVGEPHDVTDRSFTIRRALRINDRLPGEPEDRWTWQPGPWLLVDRTTGHVAALHLPDFDPVASDAVWFRDYAAYCGTGQTARGGLYAVVAQLGSRRAILQKQIAPWPQPEHALPVCQPATWQREPTRVTIQTTGGDPATFAIIGSAAIVEEGDSSEDN